jgi:N6-L-threonylcarbamoyladenine synthase
VGTTVDDAAGEAFDKGAVLLGLGYPGGPQLAALAQDGNERAHAFPLPMSGSDNFSFSGLKTSLKYLLRDTASNLTSSQKADIAASYERAICTHLLTQLERALKAYPAVQEVHIVGGVSANERLRSMADRLCTQYGKALRYPLQLAYCTDNGAMIAAAGEFLAAEDTTWMDRPFLTAATSSLLSVLRTESR